MKAAILAVGDELTCGYRLDTNSQFISRRLTSLPVDVRLHLSVNDGLESIHEGLRSALERTDVLIITGGLGPTEDDLTRQAVAAYFDLDLELDAEALSRMRERFTNRGYVMPESNRIQALVPAGSQIIQNDRGTAAGFYLAVTDKHIFATPGVPHEMEGMLEGFILARLRELVEGNHYTMRAALKLYGLAESEINERIRPLLSRERNPLLGLLPDRGTITVELVASGETRAEAQALIDTDLAALRTEFGRYIISEDEADLPSVLADLLMARGLTIAIAELGTAGLVTARLTEPEGATRWFHSSVVPEHGTAREDEAFVKALAARGAEVADVGVGVGSIRVTERGELRRPNGAVRVAVNVQGREICREMRFNGDRLRVREWAADAVLNLVRESVLAQDGGSGEGPVDVHAT